MEERQRQRYARMENFSSEKIKGRYAMFLYQYQSVQLYKLRSSIKFNKNGSQIKTANGCKDSWCLKVQQIPPHLTT